MVKVAEINDSDENDSQPESHTDLLAHTALSRQTLDSCVACIMVHLPFPPMPLLVLNGEGEQQSASSHDLLASAIGAQIVQRHTRPGDVSQCRERDMQKMAIIIDVAKEITSIVHAVAGGTKPQDCTDKNIIDKICTDAYFTFHRFFREYMTCYPGHSDLRFLGLDTVDKQSNIHTQACQHLQAKAIITGDTFICDLREISYSHLLFLYVADLYDEMEEDSATDSSDQAEADQKVTEQLEQLSF